MNKQIIFLEGKKSILRPLNPETDLLLVTKWINDPAVRCFLNNVYPRGLTHEGEWIKAKAFSQFDMVLGIVAKNDNQLIGTMGLHKIDYINGTAVTGALIGEKKFQNRGYGSDAKMQLLAYAFLTLNLRKICSTVIAFNGRSLSYSKKCGYKEEGVRTKQFNRDGKLHDEILLAVFKEDWLPLWQKYNQ